MEACFSNLESSRRTRVSRFEFWNRYVAKENCGSWNLFLGKGHRPMEIPLQALCLRKDRKPTNMKV